MSSITANYDATSLGHKGTQCTDISFDDDVAALERNATPCGGVPFNYQQPTVGSCRSRLRCMSFNMDLARHHVFGNTRSGHTTNSDIAFLVHPSAEVSDVPVDFHIDVILKIGRASCRERGWRYRSPRTQ